jgi:hypothetical protein
MVCALRTAASRFSVSTANGRSHFWSETGLGRVQPLAPRKAVIQIAAIGLWPIWASERTGSIKTLSSTLADFPPFEKSKLPTAYRPLRPLTISPTGMQRIGFERPLSKKPGWRFRPFAISRPPQSGRSVLGRRLSLFRGIADRYWRARSKN